VSGQAVTTLSACGCNRSVAVLCGLFAGLAACVFLAEDICRDGGGRVSDAAWVCEMASGASASLWSLLSPGVAGLAILAVGIPVYFAVNAAGRRILVACGLPVPGTVPGTSGEARQP
jgi:hypothetical protein